MSDERGSTFTATDLIAMVQAAALKRWQVAHPGATSIPPSPETSLPFDSLAATCWFLACTDAEQVFESMSVEDLAKLILTGEPIAGPYSTRQHIEEFVASLIEANDGIDERKLAAIVNHHFGLGVRH